MKKKSLKIYLLLSSIFFVISVTIFFFLYKEVRKKNTQAQATEIEWQSEEYSRQNIEYMENFLQQKESEISSVEKHFIYGSDVVPFLYLLEKLGPEVGAKTEVLLVDKAKDGSSLSADVKAVGDFEAVYKFLTLLENSPYELEFISLDIQKLGGESIENPRWEGIFKIKLLSFLP